MKNFVKNFALLTACMTFALVASAKTPVQTTAKSTPTKPTPTKQTHYATHTRYSSETSPWDFSAMLGLYNPGLGFGAFAAYRLVEDLIPNSDNSLSFESGINYINVSDTIVNTSISYSLIEIPLQARWDFKILDGKLIVGPRAGLNYLSASSVSIAGQSYSISRSGGLYFQVGGSAIYRFTEKLGARAILAIGGYTTLSIGLNYAL